MKDYSKLIKALRCNGECHEGCPYLTSDGDCLAYPEQLEQDAANALEELLRTRTDELNAAYRQGYDAAMPKRGEWITIRLNNGGSYTGCSCCEAPIPTDTMLDYIPESESKYCYSCGAKMEVQE